MSPGEVIAQGAAFVVAAGAFYTAVVKSKPSAPEGRSASAAEVTALGQRLDAQADRIALLEKTNRALYAYIAQDQAVHRAHGWDVIPLPEEIA